jgi:predicted metal-dependent TIM-barrel fold hydrolase
LVILLSAYSPSPLADELLSFGLNVREALAISEVFSLIEQYPEAQIIIASDVDSERAKVIQQHHQTLYLKPQTRAKDVLFELSNFTPAGKKVQ